jgi:hypothetical protein
MQRFGDGVLLSGKSASVLSSWQDCCSSSAVLQSHWWRRRHALSDCLAFFLATAVVLGVVLGVLLCFCSVLLYQLHDIHSFL